jgi:hypothetical protein
MAALMKKQFEDALISRRIASTLPDGEVSIIEVWDLKHPNCPFVKYGPPVDEPFLMRKVFASQEQFAEFDINLK